MRSRNFLIVILLLGSMACTTAAERIGQIEQLEIAMFDKDKKFDEDIARDLMGDYEQFAEEFPEHEMAPEFLDRAANIARQLKEYERGLENYQTIVVRYPDFEKIIETKFLIAFMYDVELKNKEKAEEKYKAVAEQYPDHVFGKNAKDRLVTLHMSDEELIEFFNQKNSRQ
ncbi:MAG: tetratricopeptide repeat protein [Flavobacteriales bacterium]|nr:tetratricopeptide repeat protein [Flavobacteriales bacterium]